ncbi:MAG: type II toxin-antitoxin system YoeB family toxin [Alphaproteobacteria bacterium]|nr:type II toxin-antitoxin system YoeB family toxin [Alphaproteobacteria bacterium]
MRCIDGEHRLVYGIREDMLVLLQNPYHYRDLQQE